MRYLVPVHGVALELPEGFDVSSDGSVFGPDVEFALYREENVPTNFPLRREIIEGRSPVDEFLREETLADGWLTTFRSDDRLGFELGKKVQGGNIIFWGDRLEDDTALMQVVAWCHKT